MRKFLPGGFELDDDPSRVDVAAVHRYLSEESYWARGRSLDTVRQLVAGAARVVALYADGRTIGFARAVSDNTTMVYLADVFVLPEFQGRGLGTELVREMVEEGPLSTLQWLLGTRDAHGLYEKIGFGAPDERWMVRLPSQSKLQGTDENAT